MTLLTWQYMTGFINGIATGDSNSMEKTEYSVALMIVVVTEVFRVSYLR
jgi:hypothetical protein